MKRLLLILGTLLITATLACAQDTAPPLAPASPRAAPNECPVGEGLMEPGFPLPRVAAAIAAKELDVAVIGTTSSGAAAFGTTGKGYSLRFQADLTQRLPDVAIRVTIYARPRQTGPEMVKEIERIVAGSKPALVVWQTGTADAIRGIDVDEFRGALDDGISVASAGKADIVLMNMQYSPRTETMIALEPYFDTMRFVALQHEINLFDRFSVMKYWSENDIFDLSAFTKKTDLAERVHACIGALLTNFVLESAKLTSPGPRDTH